MREVRGFVFVCVCVLVYAVQAYLFDKVCGRKLARHIGIGVAIFEPRLFDFQLFDAGYVFGHFKLGNQVDFLRQKRFAGARQALHAHAARRRREGFRKHFVGASELLRSG